MDIQDTNTPVYISHWLFSCVCTMAFIGILLSLFFIAFNVLYRKYRFVKMSSPNLNIIIIIGAMMTYACAVLFGIDGSLLQDEYLQILCKVRPCVVSIGFTLIYGSMYTKTWRVYRIFTHSKTKRMVIKDSRLICMIIGLVTVDVIILATWMVLDPPMYLAQSQNGSNTLSSSVAGMCSSNRYEMWLIIIALSKAAVLLYGTHLSWATRNVALIAMNDSACIIISVYTCVILVSLTATLSSMLINIPDAWYACVALTMWICPTVVLLLQYIPKLRAWKQRPNGNFPLSRSLTTSYLATNANHSFTELEEELFLLSAENASLKKALNEKEELILALKAHVGSATEKLNQFMTDADPSKHDSGCDVDGSSSATSHDDHDLYQNNRRGCQNENGKTNRHTGSDRYANEVSIVTESPRHLLNVDPVDLARQGLKRGRPRDRLSLRSANSLGSQVSIKSITELKKSLVEDLNCAQNLSSNLYNSISKDLFECRAKPMYYEIAKTEEALSDVITRTYHINPEDENISVASSDFTYDNPVFTKNPDQRYLARDTPGGHVHSDGQISRTSSFRSVASLAMETAEQRERSLSDDPREMQYAKYTAPEEKVAREGSPSKTIRSAEATQKSNLNTYV